MVNGKGPEDGPKEGELVFVAVIIEVELKLSNVKGGCFKIVALNREIGLPCLGRTTTRSCRYNYQVNQALNTSLDSLARQFSEAVANCLDDKKWPNQTDRYHTTTAVEAQSQTTLGPMVVDYGLEP